MVNNNPNPENEEEKVPSYEEMVQEEPEREVDLSKFATTAKTIEEEEQDTVQKTDIQAILGNLTPKFKNPRINELCQSAMVSRIFADNYQDKHYLIAAALIEEDTDPDVVAIISQSQDALSIGYEGRGIDDRLEIAGVAGEKDLEKLQKDLGL